MSRVVFGLLFWSILPSLADAQPMPEAAAQMAARIFSLLQRRATVSLDFQDLASLPAAESASFRGSLEGELRKAGLSVVATQPDARLRITTSESVRGLLLIAEVFSGDIKQVAILPWTATPAVAQKREVQLTRKLIYDQPEAILDFLLLDSGSQLLILTPSEVSINRLVDGKWIRASQAALVLARPLSRDPRGRIENTADAIRIFVPGATCIGVVQPTIKLTCSAVNEAWVASRDPEMTARWVTDRNVLESTVSQETFFSAGAGLILRTTPARPAAWGSDIAGIQNPCGTNALVVAAMSGEALEQDQIQVYEVVQGQTTAVSEQLAVPGPVTALWPSESRGQANLVIRNSKTGNYEAYLLGIACTQ
jgi:hypothetical protein